MRDRRTRVDRVVGYFKDHPVLSWVVLGGMIFIAIGQFAGAFKSLSDVFRGSPASVLGTGSTPESPKSGGGSSPPDPPKQEPIPPPLPPTAPIECRYIYVPPGPPVNGTPRVEIVFDGVRHQRQNTQTTVIALRQYDPGLYTVRLTLPVSSRTDLRPFDLQADLRTGQYFELRIAPPDSGRTVLELRETTKEAMEAWIAALYHPPRDCTRLPRGVSFTSSMPR